LVTPDELIAKYPRIDMFLCSNDPLHDDALRFGDKLMKSGKKCDITVFQDLPHGLLNLDVPNGMPEAKLFVQDSINAIKKLFDE
jgi:acetyl esterase/lipase